MGGGRPAAPGILAKHQGRDKPAARSEGVGEGGRDGPLGRDHCGTAAARQTAGPARGGKRVVSAGGIIGKPRRAPPTGGARRRWPCSPTARSKESVGLCRSSRKQAGSNPDWDPFVELHGARQRRTAHDPGRDPLVAVDRDKVRQAPRPLHRGGRGWGDGRPAAPGILAKRRRDPPPARATPYAAFTPARPTISGTTWI